MQNYISKIKKETSYLQKEQFKKATNGTHFKVFISSHYVIRFENNNQKILLRESSLLNSLNHPLIPKILKIGKINGLTYIIENRLPGKNTNILWKNISQKNQEKIIAQIIEFLKFMRTSKQKCIYSVSSGKKYINFLDFYLTSTKAKIENVKKNPTAKKFLANLLETIESPLYQKPFVENKKPVLIHGDLIIHNILTDGKKLTGIVDWEMALFGEQDHDIFRLCYYLECSKAYLDKGKDSSFEFDFLNKLLSEIFNSGLIKNKRNFNKKYQFVKSIFYLHALDWACGSKNHKKNIREIILLWNKNQG